MKLTDKELAVIERVDMELADMELADMELADMELAKHGTNQPTWKALKRN